MEAPEKYLDEVLDCANRVAGTSLTLPPDADVALEAFGFDSLSLFAFILELERAVGVQFDDVLLNHEHLRSVRSTAALVATLREAHPSGSVPAGDATNR